MNQEVPGRFALRVVWASLMVVFAAYVAVALGLGGSGLLDAFSTWVYIALVLGAAGLLALRAFTGEEQRAPWLALAAGAAMWAAGELVYEIAYSEAPDLAPYPSVADALWLGAYVAAAPASCWCCGRGCGARSTRRCGSTRRSARRRSRR